ncbi:hypothetical protein quinque_004901 [Culex quinquefasciatus]
MGLILETNGVESRDAGTQTELQLDTAPPEQQLPPRFLATMPKLEWLAISGFICLELLDIDACEALSDAAIARLKACGRFELKSHFEIIEETAW